MQVALYGGSFDPPHVGHVLAATYLLSVGPFDQVSVIPVFSHPFDKPLSPFSNRLAMCELAFGWLPGVEISDIEQRLPAPSRTLDTIERLRQLHPTWDLRLVIGADVLEEADSWYRFDRIRDLAPPWVLGRVGVECEDAPFPVLPAVSSTDVRRLFAEGRHDVLSALVPREVHRYARDAGLYLRDRR